MTAEAELRYNELSVLLTLLLDPVIHEDRVLLEAIHAVLLAVSAEGEVEDVQAEFTRLRVEAVNAAKLVLARERRSLRLP